MPLPSGGPWPPPPYDVSFAQQAIWSAWLTGDPQELSSVYGAANSSVAQTDFFNKDPSPWQKAGAALARFFWGRPSSSGQRRYRLHVPLAADIATASADLLFSEPPQFLVVQGNAAAEERVDALLNVGTFHARLLELAEITAALGGGWLQLAYDQQQQDHVMLSAVDADAAYGEWAWGQLRAVTFFTEYTQTTYDKTIYRHLERHEPGWIMHGLYQGDDKTLGHPVPLEEHPDTAAYASVVNEQGAIATGVPGLTAAYVANMLPQRRWRKVAALADMGRSDYDGVEPLMDALDETYTSWMRDLRLAKARIIVPEFMLKNLGRGQGSAWDEDQEIFTRLNMAPTEQGNAQITPQQFAIRVAEHKATADQLIDHILDAAGYSPATFGRGEGGVMTATEIVARENKSDRTRDKKARYFTAGLEPLLNTWLQWDALVFGTGAKGEVKLQWPPESQADPEALARTAQSLRTAEAASTDTLVRMMHPDWDEETILAEVDRIKAESGRSVPDLGPFATGVPGGGA